MRTSAPSRGGRKTLVLLAFLAGWGGLAATIGAAPAAAGTGAPGIPPGAVATNGGAGAGQDARGLRLGLLAVIGLALAGGVVVQVQSISTARPRRPPARRSAPAPIAPDDVDDWAAPLPDAPDDDAQPLLKPAGHSGVAAMSATTEVECARAIAAARRYDRHTTLAAFGAALAGDPDCKPAAVAGFWEMPPGGHVDLARAYLRRRRRADARSVVTFALLLFPYDRELTALLREIDGGAGGT